jgi:hypothetical protein
MRPVRRQHPEVAMALRVFRDSEGGEWRVWHVVPDAASFATLGEAYRDGWLCFEHLDGSNRRRLPMELVPAAWDMLADDRLDALRRDGEIVTRRTAAAGRPADDNESGAPAQ